MSGSANARGEKRMEEEEARQSEEEEESDDEEDMSTYEYEPEVTLADLLAPLSIEEFERKYWGKEPYATSIDCATLKKLSKRFYDGEFEDVANSCRKDDNSRHTAEEIADLKAQVEAGRRTVCMPFCFAPGAIDIKRSFIDLMGSRGYGNDIEVGVYFSRIGCEAAHWHLDPNHNITIQIQGEKDWHTAPGDANTLGGSRGMRDAPGNFLEQRLAIPNTGILHRQCINLREGSVLYIPPGHWHSVIPANGDSFSVDLRVATVPHAKWLSEALFSFLHSSLRRSPAHSPAGAVSPADFAVSPPDFAAASGPSSALCTAAQEAGGALAHALRSCPPLRAFPFQPKHSDGLLLGGTLEFLVENAKFALSDHHDLITRIAYSKASRQCNTTISVNPMVAIEAKRRDFTGLVVALRSTSSLTGAEYLRFNLICQAALQAPVLLLAQKGTVKFTELIWENPNYTASQYDVKLLRGQEHKPGPDEVNGSIVCLLRVLLHAGVLILDLDTLDSRSQQEGDGGECERPMRRSRMLSDDARLALQLQGEELSGRAAGASAAASEGGDRAAKRVR